MGPNEYRRPPILNPYLITRADFPTLWAAKAQPTHWTVKPTPPAPLRCLHLLSSLPPVCAPEPIPGAKNNTSLEGWCLSCKFVFIVFTAQISDLKAGANDEYNIYENIFIYLYTSSHIFYNDILFLKYKIK